MNSKELITEIRAVKVPDDFDPPVDVAIAIQREAVSNPFDMFLLAFKYGFMMGQIYAISCGVLFPASLKHEKGRFVK